jgi:hypothetical protein
MPTPRTAAALDKAAKVEGSSDKGVALEVAGMRRLE